ncbi:hypothetical protein AJ78_06616 [Emergomyces pasteurianus Ep9510]|uniref:BTB domain-containing protein n=1 Tax=Emergomyces pasteurianus Ep9510 TaxID=1447872 RepID=A0A1J9QCG4_9EURO|nr:hypothetical protein AJ78_06616 [Emergomyces pasteurianus Ep9510]
MAGATSHSTQEDDALTLPRAEPYIDHSPNLWKFISTDLIQIHVGLKGGVHVFNVHEGLLKSQSLFFRGMLRNNFAETKDRRVTLPDDDVKTVAVFLQWLYTGKSHDGDIAASTINLSQPEVELPLIDLRTEHIKHHQEQFLEPTKNGAPSARLLFSSYIFADKIQAPWFKNHIHNQLVVAVNGTPLPLLSVDEIRYVYSNTQNGEEDGLLRRCCLIMSCGQNLDALLEDPQFLEVCFEVKPFGVRVLNKCKIRMRAPAAAPKPRARKRV